MTDSFKSLIDCGSYQHHTCTQRLTHTHKHTKANLGASVGVHSGGGDGGGCLANGGAGELLTSWFGHHASTLRPERQRVVWKPKVIIIRHFSVRALHNNRQLDSVTLFTEFRSVSDLNYVRIK